MHWRHWYILGTTANNSHLQRLLVWLLKRAKTTVWLLNRAKTTDVADGKKGLQTFMHELFGIHALAIWHSA